jgi:hypothetical protein
MKMKDYNSKFRQKREVIEKFSREFNFYSPVYFKFDFREENPVPLLQGRRIFLVF